MRQPPNIQDFTSPVHHARVVARLGIWLGAAFLICFLTGLISHLHQHPVGWLPIPPTPAWAYRVTQGLHVATGVASVPLLLAKMYSAYPRLFERPLVGSPLRMLERGSIAVLVAASLLQVFTGVANIAQWYVFGFGFTAVHWSLAWVTIGALAVHIAVKLPIIREALAPPVDNVDPAMARERRWFIRGALGVAAGGVLLTVGQTLRPLEPLALLAKRHPARSPQGVPINRTPDAAGITASVAEDGWRLSVTGPSGSRTLSYADLLALHQVVVDLPITCVEGWSAGARWGGVRVRDLAALVGGTDESHVGVESAERAGTYRRTTLPTAYAQHPDTLLALSINGQRLTRDHGFPARIIAPNRPGVLQTKWVKALTVSA